MSLISDYSQQVSQTIQNAIETTQFCREKHPTPFANFDKPHLQPGLCDVFHRTQQIAEAREKFRPEQAMIVPFNLRSIGRVFGEFKTMGFLVSMSFAVIYKGMGAFLRNKTPNPPSPPTLDSASVENSFFTRMYQGLLTLLQN